jgi:hypothetical protein
MRQPFLPNGFLGSGVARFAVAGNLEGYRSIPFGRQRSLRF